MKSKFIAFSLFLAWIFSSSCEKNFDRLHGFQNPLLGGCQVAEYHSPLYDSYYPPRFPFIFKKTFDPSGTIVKEIQCSFWDDIPPASPECNCKGIFLTDFTHDFLIEQNGRKIYLLNKFPYEGTHSPTPGILPDTVAIITINNEGRAVSCEANTELDPDFSVSRNVTEYYSYERGRLVAIRSDYRFEQANLPPGYTPYTTIDSPKYDHYGNVLSFNGNSYQYDYTRKAKQQFYCDDFMGGDEPFYLLQFLGFFPEITSPPNIRTHVETVVFHGDLTGHQFDAEGRLVGYNFYAPISIVWNCNNDNMRWQK